MSGRGLGFSGGTLDKLESIPGYRCNLSTAEFIEQLRTVGIVVTGQSADLAPADGKLYALRDVTGTVQALPLIASSVMSKKIAAGAQAILLDVKVGQGAFMKTLEDGRRLAELMVEIGRLAGRRVAALLSDMNQPLGRAVGNALELREALDTLRGKGPEDFREHCLVAAGHLLVLGGKAADEKQGYALVQKAIADYRAFDLFRTMVKAQGGDVRYLDEPDKLAHASLVEVVPAPRSGYLSGINAQVVGETAVLLGGGRAQKGDAIDYGVGLEILRKVGERVENGEPLFIVHANDAAKAAEARKLVLAAHTWSNEPVEPLPLFYGLIQ